MNKLSKREYRANFLWPHEEGSVEEAGYEFCNGRTEEYRKKWWKILKQRILAPQRASLRRLGKFFRDHP